jgi:glycosyltransferase involved in cell wall biosynthesis
MCEAMSSGLVPITSNNTAIPEFITNKANGILTKTAEDIANAIEFLYYNPNSFLELSANASKSMNSKCSINNIVNKELQLIEME